MHIHTGLRKIGGTRRFKSYAKPNWYAALCAGRKCAYLPLARKFSLRITICKKIPVRPVLVENSVVYLN